MEGPPVRGWDGTMGGIGPCTVDPERVDARNQVVGTLLADAGQLFNLIHGQNIRSKGRPLSPTHPPHLSYLDAGISTNPEFGMPLGPRFKSTK